MSQNKRKYFEVTTTHLVSANNKADAISAALRKRGVDANVLQTEVTAERVSAADVRSYTA